MTSNVSRWRRWWLRPQFHDQPQNLLEHLPCDGDLGHLEDNIAAVAHRLRADLDQLVLQTRQRPVLDRLRRRQRAQEIAEVVGKRIWQADRIFDPLGFQELVDLWHGEPAPDRQPAARWRPAAAAFRACASYRASARRPLLP